MNNLSPGGSYHSQSAMKVQFGSVCCAVICQDTGILGDLQCLFEKFQTRQSPDITIELMVVDGKSPAEMARALSEVRIKHEGNNYTADDVVLESEFDASRRFLCFRVERAFFTPDAEFKLINRILTMAYFTVCQWKYGGTPPAMVVHSSGILRHGNIILFTGLSGTGKTTVARFCDSSQGEVLNDEMTLVSYPSGQGMTMARGIPILGDLSQRLNLEAPLKCVFSLKQGKQTVVRRLNRVEAYLRFIKQVISPAYIGQTDRQVLFSQIAGFSDELTAQVPFYELEFTLDKERLWQVVGKLEESWDKEETRIG